MIIAGSVAVVVTVFQQIAGLHSLGTREAVQRALADPPFDGLGLSVADVLRLIRVLSTIAAACAAATAILGWYALQRSRPARVWLSALAVPLFVTGVGTGGVLSTAVAVGVLMLWVRPTRDWFDGTWKPQPASGERRERDRSGPAEPPHREPTRQPHATGHETPQQQPPPYAGWPPPQGTPPRTAEAGPGAQGGHGGPAAWQPPSGAWPPPPQGGWSAAQQGPQPPDGRRPSAVLAAVVLTWVCSLLLGGLFVLGAGWLITSPDRLMEEMTRQNPELVRDGTVTVGLLRAVLAVMAGGILLWAVAACVVAYFVLRRAAWARILLLISTAAAGLALLLGAVVNPAMVVPLVGAAAVFALLLRRDVAAWFVRR
jgi:hypothetical protein